MNTEEQENYINFKQKLLFSTEITKLNPISYSIHSKTKSNISCSLKFIFQLFCRYHVNKPTSQAENIKQMVILNLRVLKNVICVKKFKTFRNTLLFIVIEFEKVKLN